MRKIAKKTVTFIIPALVISFFAGFGTALSATDYRIGIVTPTLSASEDEFRGAVRVSQKYPGMIKHISLPENYQEEQETAITQILSLGDQKDIKAIIIAAGYSGILPAIQKVKPRWL